MGTNYYMIVGDEEIHVGKYSGGYAFLFNATLYDSVDKWKLALKMFGNIKDEYGTNIDVKTFLKDIEGTREKAKFKHELLPGFYLDEGYYFFKGDFS